MFHRLIVTLARSLARSRALAPADLQRQFPIAFAVNRRPLQLPESDRRAESGWRLTLWNFFLDRATHSRPRAPIQVEGEPRRENCTLTDSLDEQALACGLQCGDRAAWAALYDQYSEQLWRYVARLVGPSAAGVADVVQETFLAAAAGARGFDPSRGSLWVWLAGIAHHKVAAHWRKAGQDQRLRERAAANGHAGAAVDSGQAQPESSLEQQESVDVVRRALALLPMDYAAILAAKYIDELSLAQMVDQYGGTVEALRSRLARARRAFREQYERVTRDPRDEVPA